MSIHQERNSTGSTIPLHYHRKNLFSASVGLGSTSRINSEGVVSDVLSMQGFPAYNILVFIKLLYFCYNMTEIVDRLLRFPVKPSSFTENY